MSNTSFIIVIFGTYTHFANVYIIGPFCVSYMLTL